ncbi:MAG: DbpA RNA binding domain-containing protein [Longimicrobiales bacterium]|nr:DbpA RNA binding domain-containing protein [Longimicrobiales bacterium]
MTTFEDLGLSPDLVEALSAEGMESPTTLQTDLIPVVHRGSNVVAVAGPGSGVAAAWAAPLLDRIPPEGNSPVILVLTATASGASALAESAARLAVATGHRVAALDGFWLTPERAQLLVGTPESVHARVAAGHLSLAEVQAVVVDGAASLAAAGSLARAGAVLEGIPTAAQRVVVALPTGPEVEAFVERHARKSVHVPGAGAAAAAPARGTLALIEVGEDRHTAALVLAATLLEEARHLMLFVRSEDAAADLGDLLALHGYASGRPGDAELPVWLAVDALEAREALSSFSAGDVAVVSVDVPADADALDQRHGGGRAGTVLTRAREIPHVQAAARLAGYALTPRTLPGSPPTLPAGVATLLGDLEQVIETEDVEAYQALLEPLFQRHGAATVAAAAIAVLRRRRPAAAPPAGTEAVTGFVRLFVSVGKRDNVRPGDLVGAITGEAGIEASRLGRIDLRDTFTLVEVDADVAQKVIRALNGTTIRGRAARVDFHREDRRGDRGDARERGERGGRDEHRRPPGGGRPGGSGPSRGGPSGGGRAGGGAPSRGSGPPRGDRGPRRGPSDR